VNEIVRRAVTDFKCPGRGAADIRTVLNDGVVVLGDPLALRRILENLIDNAIASLESRPGFVTITTAVVPDTEGPSRVRITVADTGTGLNAERRARVFDDFYTTKKNGTGLGLSIVRRLVMDLDGTIHLESEETKGSRFIIDLPRLDAADR
jgi:signal transduction histidine kinase